MSGKTLFQTNRFMKETKHTSLAPKSVDLFGTVYGAESDFKPEAQARYVPKYGGYNERPVHEVRRSKEAPVAVKFPKTNYGYQTEIGGDFADVETKKKGEKMGTSRKLVIPKTKQSIFGVSSKMGMAQTSKKVAPPPTPSTVPKVAHDHLFMFDDEEFDSPDFVEEMKNRLKEGPVKGQSLFFNESGIAEWRECFVVGYEDRKYVITFDLESGKTKEVPRIALKLESDDDARFQERRTQALANGSSNKALQQPYLATGSG